MREVVLKHGHRRVEAGRAAAAVPPPVPRPAPPPAARAPPPAAPAAPRLPRLHRPRALGHVAAAESAAGGTLNEGRATGVRRRVKAAVGTERGKRGLRRRTGRGRVRTGAGRRNGRRAASGTGSPTGRRKGAEENQHVSVSPFSYKTK